MYSNMFKKLFSDTVIYTLPTIANRLIGIVFFIFLARYLGPSDFASIELLSLALIFINRIISLEINRGFGREVAGKTHLEISKLISTTYTFLLLGYLSLLFLALLMPSSYLEQFIKINVGSYFIPLILVFIFSNSFFLMTLEIFRWALYPMTYSLLSLASVFLGSFLSFGFIYFFDISVLGFILGQVLSQTLLLLIGFLILFSRFTLVIKLDVEKLKDMLSYSYPIFIFLIAFFFLNYLDRWMINYFYTNEEVGLYSGIFRITSILSIALLGSRLAFTPVALRNEDSSRQFSSLLHFIVFSLLLLSFLLICFDKAIISLILGNEYSETYNLLPFLLLSKIFLTIYVFSPGLEINRETSKLIFIAFIPFIFGAFLSYLLTKSYGILGAALASSLTSLAFISLYLKVNEHTGRVKYNWMGMFLSLSIFIVFCFIKPFVNILFLNLLIVFLSVFMIWKVLFNEQEKKTLLTGLKEIKETIGGA